MKHETYQTLYQAHLGNLDSKALLKVQAEETDPYAQHIINIMLGQTPIHINFDTSPFTDKFLSGNPRERLDETVFTFILRLASIIKEEGYFRSFRKPETYLAVIAWETLLRKIIECTFALLYNVQWTAKNIIQHLDFAVVELVKGQDPLVLRKLMKSLGISLARDTYQAEIDFQKLSLLHSGQFSFFWRYLHWMAEAYNFRKGDKMEFYKHQWLDVLTGSFYRILRCGICIHHFKETIEKVKPQLLDKNTNFPKLWFDIHNSITTIRRDGIPMLKQPNYTESEYSKDSEFMIQALST